MNAPAAFDATDERRFGPAIDKVTGTSRYTFDIVRPGMLHAKLVRSPHAHARVRAVDVSAAEATPGVVCTITGADLGTLADPLYGVGLRDQPLIAIDRVRYIGDPVAAVVALDEATAFRAAAAIVVYYEPLPALMTPEAAQSEEAPDLFDDPPAGVPVTVGKGSSLSHRADKKRSLRIQVRLRRRRCAAGSLGACLHRQVRRHAHQSLPSRTLCERRGMDGHAARSLVVQPGSVRHPRRHRAHLRDPAPERQGAHATGRRWLRRQVLLQDGAARRFAGAQGARAGAIGAQHGRRAADPRQTSRLPHADERRRRRGPPDSAARRHRARRRRLCRRLASRRSQNRLSHRRPLPLGRRRQRRARGAHHQCAVGLVSRLRRDAGVVSRRNGRST